MKHINNNFYLIPILQYDMASFIIWLFEMVILTYVPPFPPIPLNFAQRKTSWKEEKSIQVLKLFFFFPAKCGADDIRVKEMHTSLWFSTGLMVFLGKKERNQYEILQIETTKSSMMQKERLRPRKSMQQSVKVKLKSSRGHGKWPSVEGS